MLLREKILTGKAVIGVVGLGYVGLPLAVELAKAGFSVYGLELDERKVLQLQQGKSYVLDVTDSDVEELISNKKLIPSLDSDLLKSCDVVIICVPTPLRKTRDPDLSYIISAVEVLLPRLHKQQLIILESTTYPGTTEELLAGRISDLGFKIGEDIFVAFSPERVDPGNKRYKTADIPKVVGGITKQCTELALELYKKVVPSVYPVSSARSAEMVKLLENTFRSVNIGLINEIAMICHKMDIDIWEVIDAAKTKPFGFMAFYPGPGIGGHCIPCDPLYLTWKAKMHGVEPRLVELASQINYYMPHYVVDRLVDILNEHHLAVSDTKVLVLGVAYKKNVSDVRESPAIEVIEILKAKKADVSYYDPYVPSIRLKDGLMHSIKTIKDVSEFDCAIITTDHDNLDYDKILQQIGIVFDTRGRLRGKSGVYLL